MIFPRPWFGREARINEPIMAPMPDTVISTPIPVALIFKMSSVKIEEAGRKAHQNSGDCRKISGRSVSFFHRGYSAILLHIIQRVTSFGSRLLVGVRIKHR